MTDWTIVNTVKVVGENIIQELIKLTSAVEDLHRTIKENQCSGH